MSSMRVPNDMTVRGTFIIINKYVEIHGDAEFGKLNEEFINFLTKCVMTMLPEYFGGPVDRVYKELVEVCKKIADNMEFNGLNEAFQLYLEEYPDVGDSTRARIIQLFQENKIQPSVQEPPTIPIENINESEL